MKRKPHFISLLPPIFYTVNHNISQAVFVSWLIRLFGILVKKSSISNVYNDNLIQDTNSGIVVKTRIAVIIQNILFYSDRLEVQYV